MVGRQDREIRHIRGEYYSLHISRGFSDRTSDASTKTDAFLRFSRECYDVVDEDRLIVDLRGLLFEAWYGTAHQPGLRGSVSKAQIDASECMFAKTALEERLASFLSS